MRTYRRRAHPLARGLRFLCALFLLSWLGSTVEAQERRYLLELGAGGLYQTYDEITRLDNAFGGVGRVGLWLPYNFSAELEGAFAETRSSEPPTTAIEGDAEKASAAQVPARASESFRSMRAATRAGRVSCAQPA